VVRIERLTVPGSVDDVSLTLESGIITGLAGQVGSGTSTILRALGGLVPNASGTVEVRGRSVLLNTPRRAATAGVLYIPNDRQREGLFLGQTVERNLTAARLRRLSRLGVLLRRRVQRVARELATMTGVAVDRLGSPAASLSGGNQQKVLLGRALQLEGTALLALDEPTRGVDVGGRADIHNLVRDAARAGTAVIFSSTELDEVLDLADVVVTIFHGRIVSVVPRAEASASAILADMTTSHGSSTGAAS
jgi:ABC-type sugar transport system ATPase subunit